MSQIRNQYYTSELMAFHYVLLSPLINCECTKYCTSGCSRDFCASPVSVKGWLKRCIQETKYTDWLCLIEKTISRCSFSIKKIPHTGCPLQRKKGRLRKIHRDFESTHWILILWNVFSISTAWNSSLSKGNLVWIHKAQIFSLKALCSKWFPAHCAYSSLPGFFQLNIQHMYFD